MGLMCRVGHRVLQHGIERGRQGRDPGEAGKDRAIPNFCVEDNGRPLGDLHGLPLSGGSADAFLNLGRARAVQQPGAIEPTRVCPYLRRYLQLGHRTSLP